MSEWDEIRLTRKGSIHTRLEAVDRDGNVVDLSGFRVRRVRGTAYTHAPPVVVVNFVARLVEVEE